MAKSVKKIKKEIDDLETAKADLDAAITRIKSKYPIIFKQKSLSPCAVHVRITADTTDFEKKIDIAIQKLKELADLAQRTKNIWGNENATN